MWDNAYESGLRGNELSAARPVHFEHGGDLVSTWVAKQRRAYRGPVTS